MNRESPIKGRKLHWYCTECNRIITNDQYKGISEPKVKDHSFEYCLSRHKVAYHRMYI